MIAVSDEALAIYRSADVIDLHLDSFIWTRAFGYDLRRRHGLGPLRGAFLSQCDIPRIREAKVSGGIWSITTNPLRPRQERTAVFAKNIAALKEIFSAAPADVAFVRNASEYRAAVARGLHGAFIGIQGGNAVDRDHDAVASFGDDILRVTLVHLSNSTLGTTSSPMSLLLGRGQGLSAFGKTYVERLNDKRIFVDLAHISRAGFFDAVAVHDNTQPLIVTHTGVMGAHKHWRNVDDEQLRAVADTGGTIGVMFHASFIGDPLFAGRAESIVRHLQHIIDTVGEDHASLGSDFDGMIVPPRDLRSILDMPVLVELMLRRKWSVTRIHKVMGGNFLRALALLRP